MTKKNRPGFTIVELLIVCAVIAILAGVTLMATGPSRAKARDSRRISDITQIQSALESYFAERPRTDAEYPVDIYAANTLEPNHIADVPVDPAGTAYAYSRLPGGKSYCVGANLEANTQYERDGEGCGALNDQYNYVIRR